jgi:hypothetical protein
MLIGNVVLPDPVGFGRYEKPEKTLPTDALGFAHHHRRSLCRSG